MISILHQPGLRGQLLPAMAPSFPGFAEDFIPHAGEVSSRGFFTTHCRPESNRLGQPEIGGQSS
jgi:hypothetical protein